jgi:hypothetical protein
VVERVVGEGDAAPGTELAGEAPVLVGQGSPDDRRDIVVGELLEAPDAHPRQERRVHLEVRVLGRRADQRDRAVLDVRQQRVLLGLVEAVDLVEEQDGPLPVQREAVLRLGDRRPDLDDAGHDDIAANSALIESASSRTGTLAGARRSPQQGGGEVAPGDAPAERAALADEVLLADELLEAAGPHPGRERLLLGRRLEERLRAGAAGSGRRAR